MGAIAHDDGRDGIEVPGSGRRIGPPRVTGQPAVAMQPGTPRQLREVDLMPVRRSLRRRIQEADREDLSQEAVLQVIEQGGSLESERGIHLACVIIRRRLADLRRRGRLVGTNGLEELDLPDAAPGPDATLEADEECQLLRCALESLPAQHRQTIVGKLEGTSIHAMAEAAGITDAAMEHRLRKARKAFLRLLSTQATHLWDVVGRASKKTGIPGGSRRPKRVDV